MVVVPPPPRPLVLPHTGGASVPSADLQGCSTAVRCSTHLAKALEVFRSDVHRLEPQHPPLGHFCGLLLLLLLSRRRAGGCCLRRRRWRHVGGVGGLARRGAPETLQAAV